MKHAARGVKCPIGDVDGRSDVRSDGLAPRARGRRITRAGCCCGMDNTGAVCAAAAASERGIASAEA